MTHTFHFHGSLAKYWEVLFAEFQRLDTKLKQPPFEITLPNRQIINEYVPKSGEEIIIYFWDKEHKQTLLVVEAELLPDEEKPVVQVFVHPQGNAFEEPVKSAMVTWKEIRKAINKASGQPKLTRRKQQNGNITNIYIGGDVSGNIIAGDENEVNK